MSFLSIAAAPQAGFLSLRSGNCSLPSFRGSWEGGEGCCSALSPRTELSPQAASLWSEVCKAHTQGGEI